MSSPAPAQHFVTPTHHPRRRWTTSGREVGEALWARPAGNSLVVVRLANSHPTGAGRKWGESPRELTSTDQGRSCSSSGGTLIPAPQNGGWLAQGTAERAPSPTPFSQKGACVVGTRA
eukprot:6207527-Pleurochrysis_carterae.AAC.2